MSSMPCRRAGIGAVLQSGSRRFAVDEVVSECEVFARIRLRRMAETTGVRNDGRPVTVKRSAAVQRAADVAR